MQPMSRKTMASDRDDGTTHPRSNTSEETHLKANHRTATATPYTLTLIQRASMVVWGYSVGVWLYVIAMQLRYPNSVYWPLAIWLPIRLDYLGETAFIFSFLFAMIAVSASTLTKRFNKPGL
jgi:hypothetical protein